LSIGRRIVELVPGNSLITKTSEDCRALALMLARHSIHAMQPDGEVLSKLRARSRHLTISSLISSSQSLSNQIVRSKTLLISPTPNGYRTTIGLARSLPSSTISRAQQWIFGMSVAKMCDIRPLCLNNTVYNPTNPRTSQDA
jgi:hypothetical protein